jgi:hypothetical protein
MDQKIFVQNVGLWVSKDAEYLVLRLKNINLP